MALNSASDVLPPGTVAVDDANIFYSPFNWFRNGSAYVQSNNPGAYLKTGFTGTSVGLSVDVSPMATASLVSTAYPKICWSVDNGPQQERQLAATDSTITLASGLASGEHTLRAEYLAKDPIFSDSWSPNAVVRITGLKLDVGSVTAPPSGTIAVEPKTMLVFGDSVCEGETVQPPGDNSVDSHDSNVTYVRAVASALNSEIGVVAFGGQGYASIMAGGGIPFYTIGDDAQSSWNKFDAVSGSRLVSGKFSPVPDYVVIAHGTNDGTADIQAEVVASLTAVRKASSASTWIFQVVPFDGVARPILVAAMAAYQAATPDAQTVLIDGGTVNGLTGTASYEALDGQHPSTRTHGRMAAKIAVAINAAMTS